MEHRPWEKVAEIKEKNFRADSARFRKIHNEEETIGEGCGGGVQVTWTHIT